MDLKSARAIARSVAATIEEAGGEASPPYYIVRLGVPIIGPNGTRTYPEFSRPSPDLAASTAVIQTAKACRAMMDVAKAVYVDSELIFIESIPTEVRYDNE